MLKVFAVEPHVRVLERRGNRWQIVQLHTSGRRKQPGH